MNITLENGNTKSLVLIQDLSHIPLCEEGKGFKSTDYSGYKPYMLPKPSKFSDKYYDPNDYKADGKCHMCDVRRTGCNSNHTPRYFCKKKKEKQSKLFEF